MSNVCSACFKNKTALKCHECSELSCKSCSYFVDEYEFEHIAELSKDLTDKIFCPSCYNEKIAPQIEQYKEVLELARNINVYGKDQKSETGIIRRIEKTIYVKDCNDEKSTLMKLAFQAALKGFDTIVDVDLVSVKENRGGKYRAHIWNGSAIPVDPKIRK